MLLIAVGVTSSKLAIYLELIVSFISVAVAIRARSTHSSAN
jgi:hypothetical protein